MTFTTRAVPMTEPGPAEVLVPGEVTLPWPAGEDDVLVRLKAASVNPADVYFRAFGPYLGDGRGAVLGHDGAGIVEATGPAVADLQPGDAVCFCHGGIGAVAGTYAQHAVVPAALLARLPADVDFVTAAAFPLVFITAWESFSERAAVAAGEQVLVHAGAGGTGHMALQVARVLGGRVATTVSTADKARLVGELGAERVIRYRDEDFVAAAREWTGDAGVAVAFDNVGAEIMRRTYEAMAVYGRVVTLMGTPPDTDAEHAYNGNLSIHNVMMLTPMWRGMRARLREQAAILRTGMELLAEGRLSVHVQRTFPLAAVAEAHRLIERGGCTGKLVLDMDT